MKKKVRILCLTPHSIPKWQLSDVMFLRDQELIEQILPLHNRLTEQELSTRIRGATIAAHVLGVDLVVAVPVPEHMVHLEMALSSFGITVIYEDFEVLAGGQLVKYGYRLGSYYPDADCATEYLKEAYREWQQTAYDQLSEEDVAKVVDPWHCFLLHTLRQHMPVSTKSHLH